MRPVRAADHDAWFDLFDTVAAEGRWIATEAPVDRAARRSGFDRLVDGAGAAGFVAELHGSVVGTANVFAHGGRGEVGMLLDPAARGRGLGGLLLGAVVDWARAAGLHKVELQVWPHNAPARRLYRRHGFVEEGRLLRHYRRASGELWDAVVMGLVIDTTSPGSPHPDAPG